MSLLGGGSVTGVDFDDSKEIEDLVPGGGALVPVVLETDAERGARRIDSWGLSVTCKRVATDSEADIALGRAASVRLLLCSSVS